MRALFSALALLALLTAARPLVAEECDQRSCGGSLSRCAHCGQTCACQLAVCQIERTTKKIKKPCFVVESEEYCLPKPQCPANQGLLGCCPGKGSCEGSNGDPCNSSGCSLLDWLVAQAHHKCLVPPACGEVRCRKKLSVKEQECEVPTYTCKVQYLCGACCSACGATPVETPAQPVAEPTPAPSSLPPAPLPPATSAPQR